MLELLRAEVQALTADLKAAGKELARAVVLFVAAGFFAFWSCGVLAYLGIEVLALWVSRAAAVGIVLGLLLLLTGILAFLGYRLLGKVETPRTTVRRRLDESKGWWRKSVLEMEGEESSRVAAGEGEPRDES